MQHGYERVGQRPHVIEVNDENRCADIQLASKLCDELNNSKGETRC